MKWVVTLACFLALTGTAQAGRYDPYLEIGRAKFPTTCWPITVTIATPQEQEWGDALAYPEQCRIAIPPDFRTYTRQERCEVLTHEVGHLAGVTRHSPNPRSVMYYRTTGQAKLCLRFKPRPRRGTIEG